MRWMILVLLLVAGCDLVPAGLRPPPEGVQSADTRTANGDLRPQARPGQIEPAAAPEVSVGTLGRSVASLGNAAEPGLGLKTPLVRTTRPGRVHNPQTGQSVAVTLIPIDGPATAGSRLSLAAMQALGAPLTGLIEVDVFGA